MIFSSAMRRSELEHVIRASSAISEDNEIIAIGSQAILGQFPDAPVELLRSNELDVMPKNKPERSIVVDGAIGELSAILRAWCRCGYSCSSGRVAGALDSRL